MKHEPRDTGNSQSSTGANKRSDQAGRGSDASRHSTDPLPLSFAQRQLWFLHQLYPASTAYHALDAVRLRGPLDLHALKACLNATMSRHEVLRTRFLDIDGEPVQDVVDDLQWPLSIMDLRHLAPPEQPGEIRRLADSLQHQPFYLAEGPLVEAVLVVLGMDDHVLLLRLHHVAADGWSIGILRHELATHYRDFAAGVSSSLPPLRHQYRDFTTWQRESLSSDRLDELLGYWRRKLQGLPTLDLPTDYPRKPAFSDRGGTATREIPRILAESVANVAQRLRATPFMVLLAAFQVLLSRYSGQVDFAIGVPIANRSRREWEDLIGFFVNTLVMRADLSDDPPFHDLVDRLRQTALGAYAHQELPFEMLVQDLAPAREPGRNPLFQVTFGLHNVPPTQWKMGELVVGPVDFEISTSRFDLEMNVWEHPEGLRLTASYNADLFTPETIARLLEHYERLLQGIVAHPQKRLADLPLVTDAERRNLIAHWNSPQNQPDDAHCIHQRFSAQAERTPDRIAVTDGSAELTYGELNHGADLLANRLRALGVGAEILVALYLTRSARMITAILAVLKAGGAYVPLEPDLPLPLTTQLLAEIKPLVILTEAALARRITASRDTIIHCVDVPSSDVMAPAADSRRMDAGPDNLAYLIHTSGTTGRRKAVQVTHRNVIRLFLVTRDQFRFDGNDVWTMFHSYAFDFSVWEIWGALLHGGRLVIVPWDVCRSPRDFLQCLREQQVTVLNQTPTALGQLLADGERATPSRLTLRCVILGGERLDSSLISDWFARFGETPVQLANMYGITETTVHNTLLFITPNQPASARPGIGRRLDDLQLYVLDRHGHLVPPGIPGEIHVGGAGLARGYWRDSGLTADRFRPHPFSSEPGARLYRTGDRGRFTNEGALEYLGRVDDQVKIRGIRIEPGEVTAALRQLPRIKDAFVMADSPSREEPRLIAYLVVHGQEPTVDELHRRLRELLPSALLPSAIVFIPEMPRTPQGKIDRRALPAARSERPSLSADYLAPRTLVERAMAEIWRETLRLDRVGANDNFFDLGGHSLQATRVMSRIRESFQVELPLQHLFDTPVLRDLAALVDARMRGERAIALPDTINVRRLSPPRLSYAQQRLWFVCRMRPHGGAYHIPLVMDLRGPLDATALRLSLDAIVNRHESLRTSFPEIDGRPELRIASEGHCPFTFLDWRSMADDQQSARLNEFLVAQNDQPFPLDRGPLIRAALIQRSDDRHELLLTIHHIVSDGWSIGVLRQELAKCYHAFRRGTPPDLPPLAIHYADYAEWQRQWLEGDRMVQQLDYWRRQLADLTPLRLPMDRPRRPTTSDRGGAEVRVLPAPLNASIRAFNREEGSTLFITLLAAFQLLLARYSGQSDISVGSPIANRGHRQIENLIGFFVNSLVLRTHIDYRITFRELTRQVRQTALAAYANQDLPFERLVEALQPERELDQNPLFQVMFAVQNAPLDALELDELTIHSRAYPVTTTRFDLQWDVFERADLLDVVAYYRDELFDAATVQRMLRHFEQLLVAAMDNPDCPLSELSLLDESQRRWLLTEHNALHNEPTAESTILDEFAQRLARSPQAIAVVDDRQTSTYQQLHSLAVRVASRLMTRGIRPEEPIGLCVERSGEMLSAMLGILQAGGVYVPLDQDQPRLRLERILEQARIRTIIAHRTCLDPENVGEVEILFLEDLAATTAGEDPLVVPSPMVRPDNLACIMYTSGSTGIPKGSGISHRSIMHLISGGEPLRLRDTDVVAQAANPSFDAATFEIWGALLNGARLVILNREILLTPHLLDSRMKEQGVTVLFLTTALFNELTREKPERFSKLRCLLFGGEAVDANSVRRVTRAGASKHLLHMYGPTECTTFTTAFEVSHVDDEAVTIPIGRPIANMQVYLLDDLGHPAPIGVPGELYVGGLGLARCYWNDPRATAARFVPHPFANDPGARLYRTGDLARIRPDGTMEFLARRDEQIKLRGFRIELGEIRHALREHSAVRDCQLVLRNFESDQKRLIAYVTLHRNAERMELQQSQLLDDWRRFYDDLYRDTDPRSDPRFDLVGWTSSITGQPISDLAMKEQVDQTVARILRHRGRRVLEIGVGTGLLMYRVAPHCDAYFATDISVLAVRNLQQRLPTSEELSHVRLRHCPAEDSFDCVEPPLDTVVLNSVIQYFPNEEYLRQVLRLAINKLSAGGTLFLGDVRHYGLWEVFQAAVEILRAPRSTPAAVLRQRVAFEMEHETELLVHPAWFLNLRDEFPEILDIRIEPKRGAQRNELTQFRYDVAIRCGIHAPNEPIGDHLPEVSAAIRDWGEHPWSVEDMRRWLDAERPPEFHWRNVPNGRVSTAVDAARSLRELELTAGDLRDRLLVHAAHPPGLDPEAVWRLGEDLDYDIVLDWSDGCADGRFHIHGRTKRPSPTSTPSAPRPLPAVSGDAPLSLCNRPASDRALAQMRKQLHDHLAQRLPDYMMPSDIVVLDQFPLTTRGKVDVGRLPAPEGRGTSRSGAGSRAFTPTEESVARIWREVLRTPHVGLDDNFFDLGGHSLMAMQVMTRLRERFQVELPVRTLFESPTVVELALVLTQKKASEIDHETLLRQLEEVENMSEAQVREFIRDEDGRNHD